MFLKKKRQKTCFLRKKTSDTVRVFQKSGSMLTLPAAAPIAAAFAVAAAATVAASAASVAV